MAGEPRIFNILVLFGPSGSGKSTLLKALMKEFPNSFGFSISHTSRKPRAGEVDGKDYHYVTKEEILAGVEKGDFIENAIYSGNHYGTSKKAVEDVISKNQICVLDIDMQGVILLQKSHLEPSVLFVEPPSMEILESRLRSRGTETEDAIQKRLDTAKREMIFGKTEGNAHFSIVNDDFDTAYAALKEFVLPSINALN